MIKVVQLTPEQKQKLFGSDNGNDAEPSSDRPSTEQLIHDWLRQDRNPETRKVAESWQLSDKIDHWLYPRIAFGTAGLRAQVGAGYARMNDLIVLQTTQGLASWVLRQTFATGMSSHSVVIGYDGRTNSRSFARLVASVMLLRGIDVIWLGKFVHTPLVAFTVKERRASAGVMITASHNPKEDNGYKVYAGNGCQINTPVDEEIQAAIIDDLEVPEEAWDTSQVDKLESVGQHMQMLYTKALLARIGPVLKPPSFIYTPLHGTGLEIFMEVLDSLTGNADETSTKTFCKPVLEQSRPDPEFPTVRFPNPEESGALDLAQALAEKENISLIIANDPDADRLAVAERTPNGSWYQLKGDEVGALLGWYIFTKQNDSGSISSPKYKMFTSAVSSSFLSTIGSSEGFEVEETLTGFKWIGNAALAAEKAGGNVLFGYEEALGYMLPAVCHDKDGVSAAMLFLQAAAKWHETRSQTPLEVLQSLHQKKGWHETVNTYLKSPSIQLTTKMFQTIQSQPERVLDMLPPSTNIRIRDALAGTDTGEADGRSRLPVVPGNLMITFWMSGPSELGDSTRVTIRASGTEPKIKIYIECKSRSGKDVARNGALRTLQAVIATWFRDKQFVIEERWQDWLGGQT
ncbi:MAG: hypothetical protein GOMPHAMPRED_001382 [Gomphillus americanus]|uniref:Phosphoglucomutase n=1 Tax=Gomphillus americanus TaxID=1940652 RepID=A0A8H3F200_9LECA|nr:MAG: hypothetical protein GOMPHAMPRED_001382 [Gomphillus americanus]